MAMSIPSQASPALRPGWAHDAACAMAPSELCLRSFNAVAQTCEGRDKIVRLFQYGSRLVMGLTVRSMASGSRPADVNILARRLMVALSDVRRTYRWGKELPVLLAVPKALEVSDRTERLLDVAQKVTLLMYFVIDHIAWLKRARYGVRWGLDTIQLGLKCFMLSSVFGTLLGAKRKSSLSTVRNGLLAFQAAHISKWRESSDVLVGLAGIVTSIMDLSPLWPERTEVPASTALKALQAKDVSEEEEVEEEFKFERKASVGSTGAPSDDAQTFGVPSDGPSRQTSCTSEVAAPGSSIAKAPDRAPVRRLVCPVGGAPRSGAASA
mmetsp:Transcript_7624/g.27947  ORF Transcript_7624/g.27947 Transcript_7624/m.27947 type:complete len:324 (-) Transcript_7624:318-1289(-)